MESTTNQLKKALKMANGTTPVTQAMAIELTKFFFKKTYSL
jgi:hypothetical protein